MESREYWPGWQTVRQIGKGGFGAVYEIQREVFGDTERCALKIITIPKDSGEIEYMKCEGMDDESITSTLHSQVGDIINEYKLMTRMRENPNIVHCDDFRYVRHKDDLGWDIFIKMELLTPLMKVIDQMRDEKEIIRLGIELCNALIACQKHNIIHRDIKPQNIFISPDGYYKLGDFGIARTMEHTTRATAGIGTYSFMAPEVALGKSYGPTVDIYSLGLVLYWLLNERRGPFVPLPPAPSTFAENDLARTRRYSGEEIPSPKNGCKELQAVVLKACAFDPKARYQTAQEMMAELKEINHTTTQKEIAEEVTTASAEQLPEDETTAASDKSVEKNIVQGREHALANENEVQSIENRSSVNLTDEDTVIDVEYLSGSEELKNREIQSENKEDEKSAEGDDLHKQASDLDEEHCQMNSSDLIGTKTDGDQASALDDHSLEMQDVAASPILEATKDKKKKKIWPWVTVAAAASIVVTVLSLPNGWKKTDGDYYFYQMGMKARGQITIEGYEYFFDSEGIMRTGWLEFDGRQYYFGADGRMLTGKQTINGSQYYLGEDGAMQTGWIETSGKMYYYDLDGKLLSGNWKKENGNTYYYKNGLMLTGSQSIGNDRYYFDTNGVMQTGWIELSGSQYYYDAYGKMVTGEQKIKSETCTFDDQGKLIKKVRMLKGSEIPSSKNSSDETYYKRNNGRTGKGKYQILSKPIENCTKITVKVGVSNLKAGTVDEWGFYIRDLNGKWTRVGDIDVKNNKSGSANFTFDVPVAFDAYVCFCESLGSYWEFSFTQNLSNIEVVELY